MPPFFQQGRDIPMVTIPCINAKPEKSNNLRSATPPAGSTVAAAAASPRLTSEKKTDDDVPDQAESDDPEEEEEEEEEEDGRARSGCEEESNYDDNNQYPKSTTVIMARSHPGESNISYAVQGNWKVVQIIFWYKQLCYCSYSSYKLTFWNEMKWLLDYDNFIAKVEINSLNEQTEFSIIFFIVMLQK